ncbi:hypothetical protein N9V95_00510 [bacterium]|nr:hypothetical protein [bacterium]
MIRTLLAAGVICVTAPVYAANFTYTLTGQTNIVAAENAVDRIVIDMSAELLVNEEGAAFGTGTLTYLRMSPCAWEPPVPEGQPEFCRTESVSDASFTLSGEVLETVQRDAGADVYFEFSNDRADRETNEVPSRVLLRASIDGELGENLALWGFSTGGIQRRTTHAAFLGLLVSGMFDTEFELDVLDAFDASATPTENLQYRFSGEYEGDTPLVASGLFGFTSLPRDLLPSSTDPWVYLGHWASGPGEEPVARDELLEQRIEDLEAQLSPEELAEFTSNVSQPDSRDGERDDIANVQSWVVIEAIRNQAGWAPYQPWTYAPPDNPNAGLGE